ncbi:uncharacterized protein LOC127846528 isoform X12 [Dreissena polymorpha]|uniref:uncharacterized protein LOC127846528 isoform X9 n=1 Tax=Dreissena polymorpha TaxID=45954 RepID=UPI002263C07B|nr:uncharacterized protein LOC127846528 isoform X9 [Dreissena polymorpha]XP_052233800.1 uncharacterized protein LOC127846528 isoform X11 [Dreissena polymorpha]XP_052233801.1 uncharacterized protein LOC127846528 isoform X12 [Dreissena polymorpha]
MAFYIDPSELPLQVQTRGGSLQVGDILQLFCTRTQYQLPGPFAGNQCTSMSITAISYWHLYLADREPTPADVEAILDAGNMLHYELRLEHELSFDDDCRVALDDLPKYQPIKIKHAFRAPFCFTLAILPVYVLTSPNIHGELIKTIFDFLKEAPNSKLFVLSISLYSYGIVKCHDNLLWLYDSHGNFDTYRGAKLVPKASFFRFQSLSELEAFLVDKHDSGKYGLAGEFEISSEQHEEVGHIEISLEQHKEVGHIEISSEQHEEVGHIEISSEQHEEVGHIEISSEQHEEVGPIEISSEQHEEVGHIEISSEQHEEVGHIEISSEQHEKVGHIERDLETKLEVGNVEAVLNSQPEAQTQPESPTNMPQSEEGTPPLWRGEPDDDDASPYVGLMGSRD